MSTTFACDICFDTGVIDFGGHEVICRLCPPVGPATVTVKITGLGHGLGSTGKVYKTAVAYTPSTITFEGTRSAIYSDVRRVRNEAVGIARLQGERGRNSISSGAIAIERRVLAALKAVAK